MSDTSIVFAAIFSALCCVYGVVAMWHAREAEPRTQRKNELSPL
jgi:uncharacterized membrane protein